MWALGRGGLRLGFDLNQNCITYIVCLFLFHLLPTELFILLGLCTSLPQDVKNQDLDPEVHHCLHLVVSLHMVKTKYRIVMLDLTLNQAPRQGFHVHQTSVHIVQTVAKADPRHLDILGRKEVS